MTRDGLLVKLFFGGLGELDGLRAQLLERKREAEQKLAELEEIDRNLDREEDFFPYLTLLHGLEVTRAMRQVGRRCTTRAGPPRGANEVACAELAGSARLPRSRSWR